MKANHRIALLAAFLCLFASFALAGDQTKPGPGNSNAANLASQSPVVQSALGFLIDQAASLQGNKPRKETLDAITNPDTCIKHRAGLKAADRQAILNTLLAQGLVDFNDDGTFPGGLITGVFPPVLNDNGACPHLPQPFYSSPGSVYHGHHSYPGGLPVHESNNDVADVHLADEYRAVYGHTGILGLPTVDGKVLWETSDEIQNQDTAIYLDQDVIVGAPIWHDWAKPIVFQWFSDGTEFQELNFGGNGSTDNYGGSGNSKTGGHHIMSIAEAMARGLSPAFVITQASAHSNPTSGNEYKVVNWLRAAAIMAGIDPVAKGYLMIDGSGNYRLPALRKLGSVNLGQVNALAEYELHNLSDADFTFSGPAITGVEAVLQSLASEFGYDPSDVSRYNNKYRNPVFSFMTAERLYILYSQKGSNGVEAELKRLHKLGVI